MDIVAAYQQVGSYRGAADICATSHKTVKKVIETWRAGGARELGGRMPRAKNTDAVAGLIANRVVASKGRITAERLLVEARVEGYAGSGRRFRRGVGRQEALAGHPPRRAASWGLAPRRAPDHRLGFRQETHIFSAVLAWSRWRFVRFAEDEHAETTFAPRSGPTR